MSFPLQAVYRLIEREVFDAASTPDLFNPYRDRTDAFDLPEAVNVRRANFRRYCAAFPEVPRVLLLAEAPGPWGCRFSGVPLTSEAQLLDPAFPLHGARSSTAEAPYGEYSASIYWRALRPYFPHFFTWNSVPLHPHRPGEPLTIRTPRRREVRRWADVLAGLLDALRPERVVAVGRKAEEALTAAGAEPIYVRHPSQGGATRFAEGVTAVMQEVSG